MPQEVVVVEAVAVACGRGTTEKKSDRAKIMEATMTKVIAQAFEDGVGMDSDEVRKRLQDAREKTQARFKAAEQDE